MERKEKVENQEKSSKITPEIEALFKDKKSGVYWMRNKDGFTLHQWDDKSGKRIYLGYFTKGQVEELDFHYGKKARG
jgi:hypothetical protein